MKEVFKSLQNALKDHYDVHEAQSMMKILVMHYLKISNLQWLTKDFVDPTSEQLEDIKNAVARLLKDEPLQYILGEADFYDLTFGVTPSVLIPRPETEELVEWILTSVDKDVDILDIGTGSGCIPISLKKHLPKSDVSSMDYSTDAIEVAKSNALRNGVDVQFYHDDALNFSDKMYEMSWDVIVSNPPYIRVLEKVEMRDNVLDYEPEMALFVSNEDPLIFYREIAKYAMKTLKSGGMLFFEINQYLGQETVALLDLLGFVDIQLRKDLSGNDRMIKATKE